jgi:site-specific DNA-methyltransferase (adenine-specific)
MEYMATLPDKAFELAIVDPPYGGGVDGSISRTGGTWNEKYYKKGERKTKTTEWDSAPNKEYFDELFRVSKNQIIWGGNYFGLPPSRNFIIWRKLTISENFTMAMAEYAWTNIEDNAKVFDCAPQGTASESRIHPTQKPVALYKWLLSRYAKPGDKILDTHGGSGSICIACHDLGYDLTWMELDEDYYKAAVARYKNHAAQATLFDPAELTKATETTPELFSDGSEAEG